MAGELLGSDLYAGVAEAALQRALAALSDAQAARDAAAVSAAAAAKAVVQVQALTAALGVTTIWSGPNRTILSVMQPDGTYGPGSDLEGPGGPAGPTPRLQVGRVAEGDFAVAIDLSDPANPVLSFTLARGFAAWTPVPAAVADGLRQVLKIVDWTGGQGAKPATGLYVGATGLVPDLASAVDFRGFPGPGGTVVHVGSPKPAHIAVFGDDGDHIADGGALTPFGASVVAAADAPSVKALLALVPADVGALPNTAAGLAALLAKLPTSLPVSAGQAWMNGGILSLS